MTGITRRALMAAGSLAAAMSLASMPALSQDTIKFRMATGWSGGPLMDIGAKAFAETVKQNSGGRINIEVFPAGTLGPGSK